MLPNERQLITDLFDRMNSFGPPQKDAEAEALIHQLARQNPDVGYMLVQSVLVQEQALQQTQERVEELEQQIRDLQAQSRPAPQASGGGSFLGGLFGGGAARPAPQPRATSVPAMGAAPSAPRGPWGAPRGAPAGQAGFGPGGAMQPQPQAPAAAGGGFMRSAMATAAGVAGGMLAANAISGMMGGGNSAHASSRDGAAGASDANSSQTGNEPQAAQYQDADSNDPGSEPAYDEAADDAWSDANDGGGDVDL